jgi:hypothetical protein
VPQRNGSDHPPQLNAQRATVELSWEIQMRPPTSTNCATRIFFFWNEEDLLLPPKEEDLLLPEEEDLLLQEEEDFLLPQEDLLLPEEEDLLLPEVPRTHPPWGGVVVGVFFAISKEKWEQVSTPPHPTPPPPIPPQPPPSVALHE